MRLSLPVDKQAHLLAGFAITAAFYPFGWLPALGIAVLAGAFKEWVFDAAHPDTHDVDPLDFMATVIGAVVYLAWIAIVLHFHGASS